MTAPEVELRRVWQRTIGRGHDAAFESLVARHREPVRRYHTATHVMWVCRHVDRLVADTPVPDVEVVLVATLYHDAVYEPTAAHGHNERASADLAARVLTDIGWASDRVGTVHSLIEATAAHEVPADVDAAAAMVLLDADLAILGADPAAYLAYVTGVRAEYAHVPDETWRSGRTAVLDHFLERQRLFLTEAMHAELDHRARANLSAERATLVRTRRG
jgi:predicted metal-dependent HD superfamily phosphohydrolase